ncbi:adp-ribose pyrophosphatase [Lactobacillus selangorensis]|uniref:Adp-ribose pyrophosphatase n=1 Tax=Lactobacillus selangorensis TaxID=81857 RepID=A0A0R2FHD1_9LACO|nr:NUDIX hydrolase [Lactobacillus selangorensis]KRN27992.1 adp-ribose pyrophosphatase [Lactobacillus selangorensis]KRN30537.1 adp-ribose pyrophosphatase [Lactobacillus selangorensis]
MLANENRHGQVQASKNVFSGRIFDVVQEKIKTPDDLIVERDLVKHQPAVNILAITADDQVLMNAEYRVGVNKEAIAFPAGLINPGEDVLAAAKREVLEETGYEIGEPHIMTTVTSSEGFTDEKVTLVFAELKNKAPIATHFDEDEYVNSQLVPLQQVIEWVRTNKITSSQAISSLLYYLQFIRK